MYIPQSRIHKIPNICKFPAFCEQRILQKLIYWTPNYIGNEAIFLHEWHYYNYHQPATEIIWHANEDIARFLLKFFSKEISILSWQYSGECQRYSPAMTKFTDTYIHHLLTPIYSNTLGLYSLISKMSYHKISRSLDAMRLDVIMSTLVWNLTGILAALLPSCLSNFRANIKV